MIRIQDRSVFRKADFWLMCVVLAATGFVVAPVLGWIASETLAKEQLQHPFIVLCFAAILLAQHHRPQLVLRLEVTSLLTRLLIACYLAIGLAYWLPWSLLSLVPLVIYLAAVVQFLFGRRQLIISLPLLIAFAAFLGLAVGFPYIDWTLRRLAGTAAAHAIAWAGQSAELGLLVADERLLLLLRVNEQVFHVAAECNGYGLLSSSILLVVIALIAFRAPPLAYLLGIPGAVVVSLSVNALRIVAITQLAPEFEESYWTMHEIAGLVALFAGLLLVWLLCLALKRFSRRA